MDTLKFWLFSAIPFIRNRLRCPRCKAVGTWKPHGSFFDREDKRMVHRWLCKWCGLYHGPEGRNLQCRLPNHQKAAEAGWQLVRDYDPDDKYTLYDTPQIRCDGANPWRG